MLRQRLVRQSAINPTVIDDIPSLEAGCSGKPGLFRPVSSDSFETLLEFSPGDGVKDSGRRRHSVACGSLIIDFQKPSLKSAFNSAVRRMSNACSYLTSTSSSQPSLNTSSSMEPSGNKSDKVVFPSVLGTYRCGVTASSDGPSSLFNSNRRFSTDFPPPSYQSATLPWKIPALLKQHRVLRSPDLKDMKETSFTRSTSSESDTERSDLQEVVSEPT